MLTMLLFLLLAAPSWAASAFKPSSYISPRLADFTRIDWTMCKTDAFCLVADVCGEELKRPKTLVEFAPDKLVSGSCSNGVMIKPLIDDFIYAKRWLVFVQSSAPNLEQGKHEKGGIRLLLKVPNTNKELLFGHCRFKPDNSFLAFEPVAPPAPADPANPTPFEMLVSKLAFKNRTESNSGPDKMMCIFELSRNDKELKSLVELFREIIKVDADFKTAKLTVEAITRHRIKDRRKEMSLESPTTWEQDLANIEKRKNMHLETRIPERLMEHPLRHRFIISKVVTDFNSFACTDPLARLVFYRVKYIDEEGKQVKELVEVVESSYTSAEGNYIIHYAMKNGAVKNYTGESRVWPEVACIVEACHSILPSPPMVPDCVSCSRPIVEWAANPRDCPRLRCRKNMWLFIDTLKFTRTFDEEGIVAMRDSEGEVGWYRPSNWHGVEAASCEEANIDCSAASPLDKPKDERDVCKKDDTTCKPLRIGKEWAVCPQKETILTSQIDGEWKQLSSSLHCSRRTGLWYLGMQPHIDLDHNNSLKCEVASKPLLDFADDTIIYSMIFMFGGLAGTTILFLTILCLYDFKLKQLAVERLKEPDPKVRLKSDGPIEIPDITLVRDLTMLPDDDFWSIITDFQLHSIDHRLTFVNFMLDRLGTRVSIDHYLAFFHHCSMMETDHRVWRRLVVGYKIILITFNQINRSRMALRLSEGLKMCMHRLLSRIGYTPTKGEDSSVTETRNIALGVQLITCCKHAASIMLEEAALTKGYEDIRRRRMLMAYRMRAGAMQDKYFKNWDKLRKFEETDEWYTTMVRDEAKAEAHLEGENVDKKKMDLEKNADGTSSRGGERKRIKELARLAAKWGTLREHVIYGLCCGKNQASIMSVLRNVIEDHGITAREVLAGFRACIEDCFELRWTARAMFIKYHKELKLKVPVASPEYKEIFEMFMRYSAVDFTGDDTWLSRFAGDTNMYAATEVEHLPVTKLSELTTCGRQLMKQAKAYEWPSYLPGPLEEEETEREDDPDRRYPARKAWMNKRRKLAAMDAPVASNTGSKAEKQAPNGEKLESGVIDGSVPDAPVSPSAPTGTASGKTNSGPKPSEKSDGKKEKGAEKK